MSEYNPLPKTKKEADTEEIKKRNRKTMRIDDENNNRFMQNNNDTTAPLPFVDKKQQQLKEANHKTQNERNIGLKINLDGDIVTRSGTIIFDRNSQRKSIDEWKDEIAEQKAILSGKTKIDKTDEERARKEQ